MAKVETFCSVLHTPLLEVMGYVVATCKLLEQNLYGELICADSGSLSIRVPNGLFRTVLHIFVHMGCFG